MKPRTLDDFGADSRPHGAQLLFRCPACQSRRHVALVDPSSGLWHCARCNAAGRVRVPANPAAIRQLLIPAGRERGDWASTDMPPHGHLTYSAMEFIDGKYGMCLNDTKAFGLREGTAGSGYENRILIPYMNQAGEVIYYSGRTYVDEEPKYKNMPGQHPLYVPAWAAGETIGGGEIVLVEGAFDAMKVHLVGDDIDVVALGGKALARYLLPEVLKLKPFQITIALDSDALGASLKLRNQLAPFVDAVRIVALPQGQDPGSMEIAELRELLA